MRPQADIDAEYNEANALTAEGSRKYPGMTYEEGVRDTLAWVLEETDEAPLTNE